MHARERARLIEASARPGRHTARGAGRLRLFVVDDDPAMLRSMVRVLADDCDVWPVSSASAVLDILFAGQRFDAIVSDVWMPEVEGDGMHLEGRVRGLSACQAERMVYVTGGGLPERLRRFLLGRTVVAKPFERNDLIAAVESVVSRAEGRQACAASWH